MITLLAAGAAWVIQRPDAQAQIMVALAPPATPATDVPPIDGTAVIAAVARDLAGPALALAALDRVGWERVFPDLSPVTAASRQAAVLRLSRIVTVQISGDRPALLVQVRHHDPAVAASLDRALVAEVLARRDGLPVAPLAADPGLPIDVLRSRQARATADLEAADRRAALLSEQLTETAHDLVTVVRADALQSSEARTASVDLADQGRALLGELQLKRLQLAGKYQDDFPAVIALDTEIDKLRGFLAGEQRRNVPPRSPANPVVETLNGERRRLSAELDEQTALRGSLRNQLAGLDRQIAAAASPAPARPMTGPLLAADGPEMVGLPDPRLVSVPAILLVGLAGALGVRRATRPQPQAQVLAAATEAERALGVPVLRRFDPDGRVVVRGQVAGVRGQDMIALADRSRALHPDH